ncbi:type I pantothenate kinase [Fructobacillus ficulneus]|uniref:Pantothenate kinase n=1 Tax=Fructobacillus ficulneus TaxID=157463 RepID=A0A0K8MH02_9LACO|nr:type I pantothenate kinase [Fructobacillus ficulneus]GAO99159.1 pantothenate kinase [Fructobacillus ficulneus]
MTIINSIYEAHHGSFLTVGITGSVAVGKSTLAAELAQGLNELGLIARVISTDDFLKSNQELEAEGRFDQKGFPISYHLDELTSLIQNFKAGHLQKTINKYSQTLADIIPGKKETIDRPDVLIIEGVVALQLPTEFLDQTIFVEAKISDIKDWYLQRNFLATVKASQEPESWRYQYKNMPIQEFYQLAMDIWEKTNQANYDNYIAPTRSLADWILILNQYHQIVDTIAGPRKNN